MHWSQMISLEHFIFDFNDILPTIHEADLVCVWIVGAVVRPESLSSISALPGIVDSNFP